MTKRLLTAAALIIGFSNSALACKNAASWDLTNFDLHIKVTENRIYLPNYTVNEEPVPAYFNLKDFEAKLRELAPELRENAVKTVVKLVSESKATIGVFTCNAISPSAVELTLESLTLK